MRIEIVRNYYYQELKKSSLCNDMILIVVDYLLDLYIHDLKKKHMHYFENFTFIYQHYQGSDFFSHTHVAIPNKFLIDIFNPMNSSMVSFPFTFVPLNCLYHRLTEFWYQLCNYIALSAPTLIVISNWKVYTPEKEFCGLPLVYFACDLIESRMERIHDYMQLRFYKPNF